MLVMVVFFIAFRWIHLSTPLIRLFLLVLILLLDRKSGSAGMPRPISYAVFCLIKKTFKSIDSVSVLLIDVTVGSVMIKKHTKAYKMWRNENRQIGTLQS